MKKTNVRVVAVLSATSLLVPTLVVGVASSSVAGGAGATRVLTCAGRPISKPTAYTLSCADANAGWADVTWSSWHAGTATGRGVLRQNDCTPNCAGGTFFNYRASVTLSKVVATKKYGALFSKAVFHYRVNGKAKTETFELAD